MGATFLAKIQPQPCENALCGNRKARQNAIGISQLTSLLFNIRKILSHESQRSLM
jgi:hypothetical protein